MKVNTLLQRSGRGAGTVILLSACALGHHANGQQRISGADYVDFGKDKTGLTSYEKDGTLCVVHRPDCGAVGHNGKDHFFPVGKQLPTGVTLSGVQYKVFWPAGINHTDRGGLGSEGSYGASASQQFSATPPLYSVHWENACEGSTSANWSTLPITYQVSFVISVPRGVTVKNAVSVDPPSGDVCNAADIPVRPTQSTPTGPMNQSLYLQNKGTYFSGMFGLNNGGTISKITNDEGFPIVLISKASGTNCAGTSNRPLGAHQTTTSADFAALYGASTIKYPTTIGACVGSSEQSQQLILLTITYTPAT